jgi:hypothetical protein
MYGEYNCEFGITGGKRKEQVVLGGTEKPAVKYTKVASNKKLVPTRPP